MYVHPAFKIDPPQAVALLTGRAFGTLVAHDGRYPVAAHVPFLFRDQEDPVIELHVARANPIHELIARHPQVLLACLGADAYISPDWYVSANQVPTWNYVAVHVTGAARAMPRDALPAHLDRLSAHFEERLLPKHPWTSAKMDRQRLAAMVAAVVGFTITVEAIEGQHKLGQHKGLADHDGAVAGLRARSDPAASAVADLMDAARGRDGTRKA